MKPPSLLSAALRGILFLIISVTFFGLVDGLSKLLVDTQSFGQVVLARYVVPLAALLIFRGPARWRGLFRSSNRGLQILRGLTPVIVGGAMVMGVKFMPLAEATTILFAAPFLVVAVSAWLLRERVGLSAWIAVAAGFLGVLIVARPGFSEFSTYAIFPAVAAVFYAVLQITSRQLATLGEDTTTTLAWTLLVGAVVAIPLALADWQTFSQEAAFLALGVGSTFGLGQYFLAKAFALAPANILAPFTYFQILAAVLFGMAVFNDFPDLWTWAGIAIITASGTYVVGHAGKKAA
jgi:drug/metabolite transporter (DMT)-like permease